MFVCDQGGGPPAWQWPGLEAGEEANSPAGGARGSWRSCGGVGLIFHQDQDCDFSHSQHLVIIRGSQQEALDFMVKVGDAKIRNLWFWYQFAIFTFPFCSFSFFVVLSSVLDKDPTGLKVLAVNKSKCKRSLYLQLRTHVTIIIFRIFQSIFPNFQYFSEFFPQIWVRTFFF